MAPSGLFPTRPAEELVSERSPCRHSAREEQKRFPIHSDNATSDEDTESGQVVRNQPSRLP